MTDTVQRIPTSPPPQPKTRRWNRWVLAGSLVAILLVAVGVGVVIVRANNPSSAGTAAGQQLGSAQLTSVQQSCLQWSQSPSPTLGNGSPNSAWCTEMTDWMGQQLRNGGMTGAMMWGSSTTLQATCETWMAGAGSSSGEAGTSAWCEQMANWMAAHVGDWGAWMTNGSMMGR